MPNLPTTEELRKAGEQAAAAARTPLLAALGAGDLAAKAVVDALTKAKERAESARTAAEDLPGRFDAAELRKIVDAYTQSAMNLYQFLAEHGEEALAKLKSQPHVQKALHQVDQAADDAGRVADDVLGKVSRRTRTVGEKVADGVDDATEKLAVAVEETGAEVAHEVRSTARKAAARKPAPAKGGAKTTPLDTAE